MVLTNISLVNFRNYSEAELTLSDNVNILIGNNAQGKTNILEAIYVLAITKSHRLVNELQLINNREKFCKINGRVKCDDISRKLEFFLSHNEKKVSINNKVVRKFSDYISNFNIIIFSPDDLDIIKGSPSIRRKFLNIEISQIDNSYLNILNSYNKILKTRNEYLKQIKNSKNKNYTYLNILTDNLISKSLYIYKKRFEFVKKINDNINNIFNDIMGNNNLSIKYISNLGIDEYNEEYIIKFLKDKYNSNLEKEVILGNSLYGPHKDDFNFILDNNDIKYYGSQGQQRCAVLSLKLSEIFIFKEIIKENPILLLDDIFSELDDIKKNNLIKYISDNIQTIITTTDLNQINSNLLENAKIFLIDNGYIERINR